MTLSRQRRHYAGRYPMVNRAAQAEMPACTCGRSATVEVASPGVRLPEFGHSYPGAPGHDPDDPGDCYTSDCAYGCGCWAGPSRSGGPDGVDPFGTCPKHPDLLKLVAVAQEPPKSPPRPLPGGLILDNAIPVTPEEDEAWRTRC